MIIYGISFDRTDFDEEVFDKMDDAIYDVEGIDLVTGYSVSAYEPEMAILGTTLVSCITIFNPMDLTALYNEAQEKLREAAEKGIASKILEQAEKHGIKGELQLLIVEESDD